MSWNKYCIIVTSVNENDLDEIVRSIGYHILEPGEEVDFKIPKAKEIGRNDKCPCGSGKKYKVCCLNLL